MHQALRPYATAGIALIGASIIVVTPVAAPPPSVQMRPVQLVDAYSDLFANTVANVENIVSGANSSDITAAFSALFTNPLGVISALTNLDPTVTTVTGVPLQIGVELTPALELGLAQLGAEGATASAISDVVAQLQSDPSNALTILYEGAATILNAGLNGADNVSLLGGIIDIPLYNGVLAPLQTAGVDINLSELLNALGLSDLSLGNLSLTTLLTDLFPNVDVTAGMGALGVGALLEGVPGIEALLGPVFTADPDLLAGLNNYSLIDLLGGNDGTLGLSALVTDLFTALDAPVPTLDLTLGGLLDSLNLGDLLNGDVTSISIEPFGGLITELVDVVPQQILAALGM